MKKPQAHHGLPQAPRFQEKWEAAGLDINDPEFGWWVEGGPIGDHQKWSKEYNFMWDIFFIENPNATPEQIIQFLEELKESGRYK
jgi:hypothetical protein